MTQSIAAVRARAARVRRRGRGPRLPGHRRRRLLLRDVPRRGAGARRRRPRARHPRGRLRRRHDVRGHRHAAGADGRVDDARDAGASARAAGCSAPTATSCRSRTSRSTSCCWSRCSSTRASRGALLAEARRVLKPGGRVVIVVPNDVDDERRPAAAAQVSDPLSGSPDVHDAGGACAAGCATASGSREGFTLPFRAPAVCGEPVLLRRRREATLMSTR